MYDQFLVLLVLALCTDAIVVNERFLAIEYPDPDYTISFRSSCLNYDVAIYTYDFGFDQFVVALSPGERYTMRSYLGQPFWAVSPTQIFLGNFTVHWDTKRAPAVGSGQSRHFVVKCADDYLYLCDTCAPYDPNAPLSPAKLAQYGMHVQQPRAFSKNDPLNIQRHRHEISRVRMSEFQPPDIKRYTKLGFKSGLKLKDFSPKGWQQILDFYNEHKDTARETAEHWDPHNTYVHHWKAGVTILHLPPEIKSIIWSDLKVVLGEWANVDPKDLEGSSVYGIRRYWNGSILENHVDRGQQLVLSAIINVAQEVDEPWPLQVYDHDRNSYVVFMQPGDVVLYESAVAIHGRPLPLNGKFMANIFAHTKPKGWTYNKAHNDWASLRSKFDNFHPVE